MGGDSDFGWDYEAFKNSWKMHGKDMDSKVLECFLAVQMATTLDPSGEFGDRGI